jgi:hypothetical protein
MILAPKIEFKDIYTRMRFNTETNLLASAPILNFKEFIQCLRHYAIHLDSIAPKFHKKMGEIKMILHKYGHEYLSLANKIWDKIKYKINIEDFKPIWNSNFELLSTPFLTAFDNFLSTAKRLPRRATSHLDNLNIEFNMLMIEHGQTKVDKSMLSKKIMYDIHKMISVLTGRRQHLNRIHTKLDTKRIYKILQLAIGDYSLKDLTAREYHEHITLRVWQCIESETMHTTLKRAEEGGDVPQVGMPLTGKNEMVEVKFIDHHSNFILYEALNKSSHTTSIYKSKLPTPILGSHNPHAVDLSATTAMNKSLRTKYNQSKHLNLDNVQGICTKQLFASLHQLLSDQPITDELSLLFKVWVCSNIKCTKITGQIEFLSACKKSKIIPNSILAMFKLDNWRRTQVYPEALFMSILRDEISRLKGQKLKLDLAKDSHWIKWSSRLKSRIISSELCTQMHLWNIITTELNFSCHLHKFNKRSQDTPHLCGDAPPSLVLKGKQLTLKYERKCNKNHYPHTLNDYLNRMRLPCCPSLLQREHISIKYLLKREDESFQRRTNIKMENTGFTPPSMTNEVEENKALLTDFLRKIGRNFAIPTLEGNDNAQFTNNIRLDRTRFGIRWKDHIEAQYATREKNLWDKTDLYIPFHSNRVTLPPKTDKSKEGLMEDLRKTIASTHKRAPEQDKICKKWLDIKKFLHNNKLLIVGTDKTGMNKLTHYDDYLAMGLDFLNNNQGYELTVNPALHIVTQKINNTITKLIKSKYVTIPKRDLEKLKRHNAQASKFYYLIKDHKALKADGNYPIRPIASIHGTPMDGADWLIATILQQGLHLIPAHLFDADEVMRIIHDTNLVKPKHGWKRHVISLDVVNLYPSIPIKLGIQIVIHFLRDHIHEIDLFGIPLHTIEELLELIFKNYYINFEDNIFRQTEGAPMGARSSVAFSIICMNHIETLALGQIKANLDPKEANILSYKRYIDDTIIIFDQLGDKDIANSILSTFNNILKEIQFTIEIPTQGSWMPFLNTQIKVNSKQHLLCKWYQKPTHCGNILSPNSHVSDKTKSEFLKTTFITIKKRCNHTKGYLEGVNFTINQLLNNGYNHNQISTAFRYSLERKLHWRANTNLYGDKNKDNLPLKLPFLGNTVNHVINNKIKSNKLPITLVNDKVQRLNTLGYKKPRKLTCTTCDICELATRPGICCITKAVYKLTCTICKHAYIGMTNRLIKSRMHEHANDIRTGHLTYGPGQHLRDDHKETDQGLSVYNISILYTCRNEVETGLSEKRLIKTHNPEINRTYKKQERLFKSNIANSKNKIKKLCVKT